MKVFCRHQWNYKCKPQGKRHTYFCTKCHKEKTTGLPISLAKGSLHCWCKNCGNNLCRDSYVTRDQEFVSFQCSECHKWSLWAFDVIPAPFELNTTELDRTKTIHNLLYWGGIFLREYNIPEEKLSTHRELFQYPVKVIKREFYPNYSGKKVMIAYKIQTKISAIERGK